MKTKLKSAEDILKSLRQHKKELDAIITENVEGEKKARERKTQYGQEDETLKDKITSAEEKIVELENSLKLNAEILLTESRDPINLGDVIEKRLKNLGNLMSEMRLPRTTSKEFFDLLVEQAECICGRPMNQESIISIQEKVEDYLTEDQIGVINALKQTLRSMPEEGNSIKTHISKAIGIKRKLQEEKTALDILEAQRDEYISKEVLEEIENKIHDCKTKKKDAEDQLEILILEDKSELKALSVGWKDNFHLCNLHINELKKQLEEATGTVIFSSKGKEFQKLIDEIIRKSLNGLKEEIKNKTNEKIDIILNKQNISIEDISSSLIIASRADVSEGQKLSIAYSFLSSLFEQGYHDLPFIVDSPAVSIDLTVRKEVSELIPPLFDQFIVFVISSERFNFGEAFYHRDDSQLLTIHKGTSYPGEIHVNSTQKYFDCFQSENDNGKEE